MRIHDGVLHFFKAFNFDDYQKLITFAAV